MAVRQGNSAMLLESRHPDRSFTIRQLCVEFKVTPRALRFYEDKGLLSPAREGQSRVYSHPDRARLILILRGKRVGLSLAEIRDLLDLYKADDSGAAQMTTSVRKFRERIAALEVRREDVDHAIAELKEAVAVFEDRLAQMRRDLLPQAADYDTVLRARLDGAHESAK
jgi:DNA-binding transcriptional MerR regulator